MQVQGSAIRDRRYASGCVSQSEVSMVFTVVCEFFLS